MHLLILHGYLLQGTGSNVYVANVARAWAAQGHAVTVICQDRAADSLPFVDEFVGPGHDIPENPPAAGRLRVVMPSIGGLLPVYVMDTYTGFEVKTVPSLTADEIDRHVTMTGDAVRAVVRQGVDRVLANHVLLSPVVARRALGGRVPYDVKIHGSAVEYSLVPNAHLLPLAEEGLDGADRVFAGSRYVRDRVTEVFAGSALALDAKLHVVPPGMDPALFHLPTEPEADRAAFRERVAEMIRQNPGGRTERVPPRIAGIDPVDGHRILLEAGEDYDQRAVDSDLLGRWADMPQDGPLVIYVGKFLPSKGVGELMLRVPELLQRVPDARVAFVGFGTYREHLEGMLHALAFGDLDTVLSHARAGEFVSTRDVEHWYQPLPPEHRARVIVTGMLDHAALAALLPLASVSVVPSKWPEAFGMVAVEAMAAGVLPLCNYHAGLRDVVDAVADTAPELAQLMQLDRDRFVDQLPAKIESAIRYLHPAGSADAPRRSAVAGRLRGIAVDRFAWDRIAVRLVEAERRVT